MWKLAGVGLASYRLQLMYHNHWQPQSLPFCPSQLYLRSGTRGPRIRRWNRQISITCKKPKLELKRSFLRWARVLDTGTRMRKPKTEMPINKARSSIITSVDLFMIISDYIEHCHISRAATRWNWVTYRGPSYDSAPRPPPRPVRQPYAVVDCIPQSGT